MGRRRAETLGEETPSSLRGRLAKRGNILMRDRVLTGNSPHTSPRCPTSYRTDVSDSQPRRVGHAHDTRELTDAKLVELCLDGHKESYAELVSRYQDSVYGLAYRMTRNQEDAADMAQEAFIRAYRHLRRYDPRGSFKNWVMAMCANLTKNRFRGVLRRRRAEETHVELHSRDAEAPDLQRAALEEALGSISQTLRVPLVLKHVEGLPYEDIAQVLGIGVSAAKMRVKRGRDELVRLLRPEARGDVG
jgi:RNA polymerase sigma-70 factor (ECF subfamily)